MKRWTLALSIAAMLVVLAAIGNAVTDGYTGLYNLELEDYAGTSQTTEGHLIVNNGISWTHKTRSVSLTSPTTAIAVQATDDTIILNSDANQTGHTLTGGTQYQEVTILSGDGSNTMEFTDNGATMAVGSNVTLTEGQTDMLTLICTNSAGTEWAAKSAHDN